MPRVLSYDVFDTVLTRRTGDPGEVYAEAARLLRAQGLLDVAPAAYRAVRDAAHEDLVRRGDEHVPLARIVDEVADRLGLAASAPLLEAELDAERSLCRAVPGAPERLAHARSRTGRGVLFVSDTPLPEAFLRELLAREGLYRDGDTVYGSGDRAASKEAGRLYDVVAADCGVEPSDLEHVGDSLAADVRKALLHGWTARHDASAAMTAHERRLDRASAATDGYASRLAGAARLGRLAARSEGVRPALAGIGSGVGMPLLAGYALWLVQQARLRGLDRLYFVARDGEVMREAFLPLAAQAGLRVEAHYLYGSRIAWHVASTATATARDADEWLYETDDAGTVREVVGRLGLTLDELRAVGDAPILHPSRTEHVLSPAERAELRALLAAGRTGELLADRAREQRELMLRYLDQEGLTGPGRVGIVDVGWRGRTARSLEEVLRGGGRPLPAAHLFVGLLHDAPDKAGPELFPRCHAWLFDEARGAGVDLAGADIAKMVETFTGGREGYTLGYRSQGSEQDAPVGPRLARPANDELLAWGLPELRCALDRSLSVLAQGEPPSDQVDLRTVAWQQLRSFWERPSAAEAEVWSAQPWGADWAGSHSAALGPPVRTRAVLAQLRGGRLSVRPNLTWYEGVALTSGQPWRGLLLGVKAARRAAPRLRRIPDRLRGEIAVRRSR